MSSLSLKIFFGAFLLLQLSAQHQVCAKTHILNYPITTKNGTKFRVKDLEEKLRPYLENRISHRRGRSLGVPDPALINFNETDLYFLTRSWNSLSPAFKKLYNQALQFPDSMLVFSSPGGNFEIYYSIKGADSVPTTDDYMFDLQNWRSKQYQKNGVPDYIDEVAWALDSTWSMEIDKFKFIAPYPYKDNKYQSDKYKVIIEKCDDYGYTLPYKKVASNGFSSYITIRNEWLTFDGKELGYHINPLPAIRVTCSHEFFHAIQYAMSWEIGNNIELDNFPLSWIEGCAVTMEEMAFPDINDYHQYARAFFENPRMSFFSQNNNLTYSNSLLLIFISTRLQKNYNVDFIRNVHYRNFKEPSVFASNIEKTSSEAGLSWPQLLNNFHTASYFSGLRTDTNIFINDAASFKEWYYTNLLSIQNISSNSMGVFSLKKQQSHDGILHIYAGYQTAGNDTAHHNLAASSVIHFEDSTTITPFPLDSKGCGSMVIPQWDLAKEIHVIVSNGFSEKDRKYDLTFVPCTVSYSAGVYDTIFPNTKSNGYPCMIVHAIGNLDCGLSFSVSENTTLIDSVKKQKLVLVDSLYYINYPAAWKDSSELSILTNSTFEDTLKLCIWNSDSNKWITTSSYSKNDNNTYPLNYTIKEPGTYGFFTNNKESKTNPDIVVFPNPVRINNGTGYVLYEGYGITEAAAYSLDGSLVFKTRHSTDSNKNVYERFRWNLRSSNGNPIFPGTYTFLIKYSVNSKTKLLLKKILFIP